MKISDYVINTLAAEGVTHIFEVCGGALGHLLDSLYGRNDIQTVSMHHEMAAAIAAEGIFPCKRKYRSCNGHKRPGCNKSDNRDRELLF